MRHDVYREDIEGGNSEVWTYTPGNGTLYKFIVARFPKGANVGAVGAIDRSGAFIFAHIGMKGYLISDGSRLSPGYVAEKFDVHGTDLAATMVALGAIVGAETQTYDELVEKFETNARVVKGLHAILKG